VETRTYRALLFSQRIMARTFNLQLRKIKVLVITLIHCPQQGTQNSFSIGRDTYTNLQ